MTPAEIDRALASRACVRCRWVRGEIPECAHPSLSRLDAQAYVQGRASRPLCITLRDPGHPPPPGRCGPQGKYWSARPWWRMRAQSVYVVLAGAMVATSLLALTYVVWTGG